MKTIQTKLLMLLILVISVTTAISQNRAQGLQGLVGTKGASMERELVREGYYHIKTHRTSNYNLYSYWWNNNNRNCIYYNLNDGRVSNVHNATPSDCNKSTYANKDYGYYSKYKTKIHHYPNQKHYPEASDNQAFDRGFQDGLHHKSYHNFYDAKLKGIYATGYTAGTTQRKYNTSYHSGYGGYGRHIQVHDVDGMGYEAAYRILERRGFKNNKQSMSKGREYTLWYNRSANQCIRTIRGYNHIIAVETSTYCNR